MKREYLLAATALLPQAAPAHSGVENESVLVTLLHSLAHMAGAIPAPALVAIGLCVVGVLCLKGTEKKS